MRIRSLDKSNLETVLPLLSASIGFDVGLEDEVACLESGGGLGVFSVDPQGRADAFIRCFSISSELRLIEAYPVSAIDGGPLFESFYRQMEALPAQTFRFDVNGDNDGRAAFLRRKGFVREKIFLRYQLESFDAWTGDGFETELPAAADVSRVCRLMSELHPYVEEQLAKSFAAAYWRVARDPQSRAVVAAALFNRPQDSSGRWELVEVVVDPELRGQGLGTRFLGSVLSEVRTHGATSCYLKVEAKRLAARRCYEKLGFRPVPEKSERWMYLPPRIEPSYSFDQNLRDVLDSVEYAESYVEAQIAFANATDDPKVQVRALGQAGSYLRCLGRLDEAEDCLRRALELVDRHQLEASFRITNQIRLAHVYQWKKKFDVSGPLFQTILTECQSNPRLAGYLSFAWQHLGKHCFDAENYEEAAICFENALRLRKGDGSPPDLIQSSSVALHEAKSRLR